MSRTVPWYPVVAPLGIAILVWSGSFMAPIYLVRPAAVIVGSIAALVFLVNLALRDLHRAGLASCTVVVAITVQNVLASMALLLLTGLVILEGRVNLGRPWERGPGVTRALNTLATALLVVLAFTAVQNGSIALGVGELRATPPPLATSFDASAPDVYAILLDGYPGEDALATLAPSFNRTSLVTALTAREFAVERHARSNYLVTSAALGSIFGGRQLRDIPSLANPRDSNAADIRALRDAGEYGPIWQALGAAGVERVVVGSGWVQLGQRRVDRFIDLPQLNDFELTLLGDTGLGGLVAAVSPDAKARQLADRIRATLSTAADLSADGHARPRFTFVHVPAPHEPWVFTASGSVNLDAPGARIGDEPMRPPAARQIEELLAHISYLDTLVVEAIDRILAASPRPAVIAVFSDHGSGIGFDPHDTLHSDLNERTSNLVAVRAPGRPDVLPPGTTPVNVLPRLLNASFGTQLPLQPDTTWGWRGGSVLNLVQIAQDPATGSWQPQPSGAARSAGGSS